MSPARVPRFYAILDPALRPELPLAELVRMLADAGVRLVQLRAKQASSRELLVLAGELQSLLPSDCPLIVNDRADVAALAGAAGVHLGQDDLPAQAARELLGPDKLIGLSTHNKEHVKAAAAAPVDYLAFGPIFATISKDKPDPVVGCEGLSEVRRWTRKPLVAIGGITPENAGKVIEAGADSVAVISGWLVPTQERLAAGDIPRRLEEFRRALGRLD
ncbi:MAG: thiamine phosphate synthase [Acidobacteria bacterium]|nr:thiamine phosphate synthase [Acidobacteriota bacterium]